MERNWREPPGPSPQEGPPFTHRNDTESVLPDRYVDTQPDLPTSVPNPIHNAQIHEGNSLQTIAPSLEIQSIQSNTASTNRKARSLNVARDHEHALRSEKVDIEPEMHDTVAAQSTDSRRETGPSSGRQVTFTDSTFPMHDNISNQGPDSGEVGNQSSLMNVPHDLHGVSTAEHDLSRNPSASDKYPSYVYTDSRLPTLVARGNRVGSNIHTMENIPSDPVNEITDAMSTCYTDNANSTQTLRVTVPIKTDIPSNVPPVNKYSAAPARPPSQRAYRRPDTREITTRDPSPPRLENRFRSGTQEHRDFREQRIAAQAAYENVGADPQEHHPLTGPSYTPSELRRRVASRSIPTREGGAGGGGRARAPPAEMPGGSNRDRRPDYQHGGQRPYSQGGRGKMGSKLESKSPTPA